MPSGERKPVFLNCTEHFQMQLKAKPYSKWTQEPKSFVSQINFTINHSSWEKAFCFGKFVQVLKCSESSVTVFSHAMINDCALFL